MPEKGWINAGELCIGDVLVTIEGSSVIIDCIYQEQLDVPEITYNFEVEGFHTYYVSDVELLVHNACQIRVAGERNGFNAKVSVGGEPKHRPHAHIFWKNERIASVDSLGKITAGYLNKTGRNFVKYNLLEITFGINKWWNYGK